MLNSAQNLECIKMSNIQASIHSNCSNQDDPMHEIERGPNPQTFKAIDLDEQQAIEATKIHNL